MSNGLFRLDGRRAVVTGGAGGIGLAAVRAFVDAGAEVVILDIDDEALEGARRELQDSGRAVRTERLDVTDPAAVDDMAERLNADGGRVDVAFANAGIGLPERPAEDMPPADWSRMIDVNLSSVFWTCQAFGRRMLTAGGGSVVATGSMSGIVVNRPQRQAHYNAAKAGVHQMVRSLAAEWASRGVRVNAIAPGYVRTRLTQDALRDHAMADVWLANTPSGRIGEVEEVAPLVLFLASDAARLVTGEILVADGGYSLW